MIHPVYIVALVLIIISIALIAFISKPKTLISIVTIDRDAYLIPKVYQSIKHLLNKDHIDLLIVCRTTDIKTQDEWKKIDENILLATINHYDIYKRHNLIGIRNQRNVAIDVATKHNYDYLFFIDSDIIIQNNTYDILLEGCRKYSDICLVPYMVRWTGYPAVCVSNGNNYNLQKVMSTNDKNIEYLPCLAGGMGCTLIPRKIFTKINFKILMAPIYIPDKQQLHKIRGEDIGFFFSSYKKGYKSTYVQNHSVLHLN